MSASFVDIGGGHRLFVRDWGAGPPVLLLAGWGVGSAVWGETMMRLNALGLRTVAYDRRGHGASSDAPIGSYDALADDLAALLNSPELCDLTDITLVAHSGAVGEAIRYLSRYGSSRIRQMVMVAPAGPYLIAGPDNPKGFPRELIDMGIEQLSFDLAGWIDANLKALVPGASERIQNWLGNMVLNVSRRAAVDFQRLIFESDWRRESAEIKLPVTLIHGDRDVSAPMELCAGPFTDLIPGAKLCIYQGAGHGVMVTHASRLAAEIGELARLPFRSV